MSARLKAQRSRALDAAFRRDRIAGQSVGTGRSNIAPNTIAVFAKAPPGWQPMKTTRKKDGHVVHRDPQTGRIIPKP